MGQNSKEISILKMQQFQDGENPEEFHINTLQNHLETRHKDIALPHKHDFYVSVLFTKGSGIHEVDFTVYDVVPGSLFFLNPGQTHHWDLSPNTEGYIFLHTRDFYNLQYTHSHLSQFPFYYSMHNSPMIQLTPEECIKMALLFKSALTENCSGDILRKQMVLSLIDIIYIESTRLYMQQTKGNIAMQDKYSVKFSQLEALVEQHFRREKSPSKYAAMLNLSPKHLNRITQAASGKTTSDMITERVLLEARKEILLQRHNFNEIAHALGYDDYTYFSRQFKKKTGETPSQFLARYL
jgi:AraC family transcriptional activator of pobA